MIFVIALLGGAAYAAKYYYDTTQATIAQLRENNAKLEVANEENQATITKMTENNVTLNVIGHRQQPQQQLAAQRSGQLLPILSAACIICNYVY